MNIGDLDWEVHSNSLLQKHLLAEMRGMHMEQFQLTKPKKPNQNPTLKPANPSPFHLLRAESVLLTSSIPLAPLCSQPSTWRHQAISEQAIQGSYFISCNFMFSLHVISGTTTHEASSHSLLSVQWTSGHSVSPLLCSVVTCGKVMLIIQYHSNAPWDSIKGNHNKRHNILPPNPLQSDTAPHIQPRALCVHEGC